MKSKGRKSKEFRINQIRQAVERGVTSIKKFEKKTGLGILTLRGYAIKGDIKLPFSRMEILNYVAKNKSVKRFPERDKLIRDLLSTNEMSGILKLPKETLHQYIIKTGQHETWLRGREKMSNNISKEKREALENLVNIINLGAEKNIKEDEKWAYWKVTEYKSLKNTYKSFKSLFGFFKKYEYAKNQGIKISLEELGKDFGIQSENASYILRTINENPLNTRARNRIATPKYKKEAVERCILIKMTNKDKAYFLKLPHYTITKLVLLSPNKSLNPTFSDCLLNGGRITYRKASQIYEAQDLGFSKQGVMELLDISEGIFDYANESRKTIENKIIETLKIMYLGREISKPYIDFK